MTAAFRVTKPGFQTTVQDLGRFGYRHFGVPVSGGIDSQALKTANLLTGNNPGSPCLEATLLGPELYFLKDGIIAITGADMQPRLSGIPLPMWESILCKAGETLSLGYRKSGCRSYIAFAGGIEVPQVLGSYSTLLAAGFGGLKGRSLQQGDILETYRFEDGWELPFRVVPKECRSEYQSPVSIRVIRGINADIFEEHEYHKLFSQSFTVTNRCNRMGCSLDCLIPFQTGDDAILESFPVTPGTIQVPPSGNPIVLLNDAQSTGGYPQIACVISADLWKLGQVIPGDNVNFIPTGIEEALEIGNNQDKILDEIISVDKEKYFHYTGKNLYEIVMAKPNMGEN